MSCFLESCFIKKNTPELRKRLEKIGYKLIQQGYDEWFISIDRLTYLKTYIDGYYQGFMGKWDYEPYDCGDNEELFIALAAMNGYNDKYQWMVSETDGDWYLSDENYCVLRYIEDQKWRKATKEEIINKFKNNDKTTTLE